MPYLSLQVYHGVDFVVDVEDHSAQVTWRVTAHHRGRCDLALVRLCRMIPRVDDLVHEGGMNYMRPFVKRVEADITMFNSNFFTGSLGWKLHIQW